MHDNRLLQHGLFYGISAFVLWGFAPIFFKAVEHVTPEEVLAHRVIWSVLILALFISLRKQWRQVKQITWQKITPFFLSSIFVSSNWFIFIWAVGQDRILETSLGYFINPLVSVILGVIFLGERLRKVQLVAVLLAALGVLNQISVVGYLPWVALALAFTFGFYALMRKSIPIDPVVGLFYETILLTPIALAYLYWLASQNEMIYSNLNWTTDILLICAGLMTTIPLLLFAAGTQRLSLTVISITQYITPSMTFFIAIFLYNEPFSPSQLLTFILIWAGLAIFTFEGIHNQRKLKRQAPFA